MSETMHFTFFLVPEFTHIAFSCALEPLRIANLVSGQALYSWTLASEGGKTATCSNGSVTLTDAGMEAGRHTDRLFLISGLNVQAHATPRLLSWLRRERAAGTPMAQIPRSSNRSRTREILRHDRSTKTSGTFATGLGVCVVQRLRQKLHQAAVVGDVAPHLVPFLLALPSQSLNFFMIHPVRHRRTLPLRA